MLATSIISIGIKFRIAIPVQRLCASIKMYSASSGSASDSSDSDSDPEHVQKVTKQHKNVANNFPKQSTSLNFLIDKIIENNNAKITNAAALSNKTTKEEKVQTEKDLSYEAQLTKAAENVTNVLSGDKEKVKSQLLDRLSYIQGNGARVQMKYTPRHLNKLVTDMTAEQNSAFIKRRKKHKALAHNSTTEGIIHQLSAQKKKENEKYTRRDLPKPQHQVQLQGRKLQSQNFEFHEGNYSIFSNIKKPTRDIPELSTWESLEERQLSLLSDHAPQNVFQEMIQWTESGKLWTFPIDNEYGMEEEHNVHFSEHVFLERHLKDWCPKRGPIRHFMELVCIGLSKNPYMTVNEKIGHITWYKEYFKGKEELLTELGAIDAPSNVKEQMT